MQRRRYWLWIALFVAGAFVLSTLATGWNFVLVRDYRRMLELARAFKNTPSSPSVATPVFSLVLGTLGFFVVLGALIMLFVRLLLEMRQNQRQSEFLATVSHELKTPIAAIELGASLLREENLTPEERDKLWDSIQSEVTRLKGDVESLLEAARWEAKHVHIEREAVDIEEWIQASLERWREQLGPGAELRRTGQPLRGVGWLDRRKLGLVSGNILQNARKYAKTSPHVEIHTQQTGTRWKIEFRDQGCGFEPRDAKKLMKPFYRSSSHATTESRGAIPGTGLGLYIANEAARSLGLKIQCSSPGRGKGSVFVLQGTFQGRRLSP